MSPPLILSKSVGTRSWLFSSCVLSGSIEISCWSISSCWTSCLTLLGDVTPQHRSGMTAFSSQCPFVIQIALDIGVCVCVCVFCHNIFMLSPCPFSAQSVIQSGPTVNNWVVVCTDGWQDGCVGGWMDGFMDGWMCGWMCGWMDVWVDGWMCGWMDGCVGGWMDVWVDGRMCGWMDVWVGRWIDEGISLQLLVLYFKTLASH